MKTSVERGVGVHLGNRILAAAILVIIGTVSHVMPQSPRSLSEQLVGTWRFVSANQQMVDGTIRPDPQTGPKGKGYIIYTETGQMCAMITDSDRPKWKSEAAPREEELRSAFSGLVAYCGTYEVNEKEKYVVHHIEFDRVPNRAGSDRLRFVSFSGNRLTLRPKDLPEGVRAWDVVWERVVK